MAYDYSEKTLERWDFSAQAETYRLKFEHELRRAAYWQHRALTAEAERSGITVKPSAKQPAL